MNKTKNDFTSANKRIKLSCCFVQESSVTMREKSFIDFS